MICPACFAPSQRTERYWYYSRHGKGRQYWRHCRRAVSHPELPPSEHDSLEDVRQEEEEVLLDEDELAGVRGTASCNLQPLELAWRQNTVFQLVLASVLPPQHPAAPLPRCPAAPLPTAGLRYLDVAGPVVSPGWLDGEATMAYGVDATGDEVYTL